jgi:hypothetical protein
MGNPGRDQQRENQPNETPTTMRIPNNGHGVSAADYKACVDFCKNLGNSTQEEICIEGCRSIDSAIAQQGQIAR